MTGSNGNNGAASPKERYLDLDAFVPNSRPGSSLRIDGIDYPVRQIHELTGQEELDLAALDRAVDAVIADKNGTDAQMRRAMFDRAFTMVRLLVPSLPEKQRLALRYDQANAVAGEAWAYATASPFVGTEIREPAGEANSRPASEGTTAPIQAS